MIILRYTPLFIGALILGCLVTVAALTQMDMPEDEYYG